MLLKVLRKCWTGMIIKHIMNVIEDQGVRSEPSTPFVGIAVRTWPTFSLRTRYRPAVSLEQLIEADPRFLNSPPPTCAEILTILSSKLGKLCITPAHLTELHAFTTVRWTMKRSRTMRSSVSRSALSGVLGGRTYLTKREDLLMKIHHAIISVPSCVNYRIEFLVFCIMSIYIDGETM